MQLEVMSRLGAVEAESASHTEEVGRWAANYSTLTRRLEEHDNILAGFSSGRDDSLRQVHNQGPPKAVGHGGSR